MKFVQYVEDQNVFHLVSLDTGNGTWGDWFSSEDMNNAPPGFGEILFVIPVPE